MRKIYSLAVLLALMLASTTARAQDADFTSSVTVEYWASNGYASTPVTFALTSVAEKLGMTVQQLVSELETSYPEEEERGDWPDTTIPFSSKMQDGTIYSGSYTADGCGYWMDANGDPCAYDSNGETCKIFDRLTWDEENLIILVGRHPGLSTEGGTYTIFPTLTYGEKTVVFKIDYTYEERPVVVNETTLSKLNMLTGVNVQIEQKKRSNFDSDVIRVEVPTLLSDLGFADQSELVMNEALYAQVYMHDGVSDMYQWADSITNQSTADAPGFWFHPTYEYPSEDADPIEDRTHLAAFEYNNDDLFYAEAFSFLREEGVDYLTFNVGQMGNAASDDGENYNVTLYIVNGTLAYPVNINLVIDKVDKKDFADMEMAGETTLVVKLRAGEPTTSTSVAAIDNIDAVLEAIGEVSASDLEYYGLDSDGILSTRQTANGGGSWFNGEGYVVSYGSDRDFYIQFDNSKANWTVGTYLQNNHAGGDCIEMKYYLLGRLKYWQFNVTILYTTDETDYSTWKKVGTMPMTIQGVVPTEEYEVTEKDGYIIPIDQVKELLGSNSFTLFGQKLIPAATEGETDHVTWSDAYSCSDPEGHGFWMADNGTYVSSWGNWGEGGSSYAFSMVYSTGEVYLYNQPGTRQPGDTYRATFYLANVAAETYVELPVVIKFVSSITPFEIAGEQDIVVAWEANADGISYGVADLTPAIDGLFEGDASLFESCDWLVEVDGQFIQTSLMDIEWNVFDAEGKYLGNQDDADFGEKYDKSAFTLGFDFTEQAFGVESFIDGGMGWGSTEVVKTNIAMDYNGKRWIFHCYIGDKDTIETGISEIAVKAESKKEVFDLAGRRVSAPVKGLYILNGKKVFVK